MKRDQQQFWDARYQRSRRVLKEMLEINAPKTLLQNEARLLLTAVYGGTWRLIWALIKHEFRRLSLYHGRVKWEWIRTRIFRRPQDLTLAEAQRTCDEMDAVDELAKKL